MEGMLVGRLRVLIAGDDPGETNSQINIRGNDLFYLGRSQALCRRSWPDPKISNRHLRIHCILYEQYPGDPSKEIKPLVYATDFSRNGTHFKRSDTAGSFRMGTENRTLLLNHRDEITISDSVTLIYEARGEREENKLTAQQMREINGFASRYLISNRTLGEGAFGRVQLGIHQETQKQLACKIIDVRSLLGKVRSRGPKLLKEDQNWERENSIDGTNGQYSAKSGRYFREFDILKDLDHPNIIAVEKVFWSPDTVYIFQELVTGGDLFSYLQNKGGRLCDIQAAVIIRQLLKGVEYLHSQGVVHRDIKPDNILMTSPDDGARIVITDFGHARFLPESTNASSLKAIHQQRMHSVVGTRGYIAPEILVKKYSAQDRIQDEDQDGEGYSEDVDMWSVGSVTVVLLSGDLEFGPTSADVMQPLCPATASYPGAFELSALDDESDHTWCYVGPRPKDFIKNLLVMEEKYRMTASEALAHPWFTNETHAANFDALYSRSIKGWKPRRKSFRIVEPIARRSPNSAFDSQMAHGLSRKSESCSSIRHQPYDLASSVSKFLHISQCSRPNLPLSSIIEDDEGEDPLFASQIIPESPVSGDSEMDEPGPLSASIADHDSTSLRYFGFQAGNRETITRSRRVRPATIVDRLYTQDEDLAAQVSLAHELDSSFSVVRETPPRKRGIPPDSEAWQDQADARPIMRESAKRRKLF